MSLHIVKKLKTTRTFKYIMAFFFYVILRVLFFSYRLNVAFVDKDGRSINDLRLDQLHGVFYFWHQHIISGMFFFFKNGMKGSCVVSSSDDGKIAGFLCKKLGFTVLYGSSHKQPITLVRQALIALKCDGNLCLVGDGSRGPAFVLQQGVRYLAEKTTSPLIFIECSVLRALTFSKSWDQFKVPLPFTTISVVVHVPDELVVKIKA